MLVVDLVITWHCLMKEAPVGENLLKAQFHIKTGFIFLFYCHTVSLKLTVKKGKFCGNFLEKVRFFGKVSWNCDIGLKCWNCQIRAEKNWNCRHEAAVSIFSGRTDSFNILAKSRFHETTQKFNFDTETVTKNCHFYCQFQVKLTRKKKNPIST